MIYVIEINIFRIYLLRRRLLRLRDLPRLRLYLPRPPFLPCNRIRESAASLAAASLAAAEYWQDCTPEETVALWEHEWSKHGTCVSIQTGFEQNEYFEKTVALYEGYPDGGYFDLDFVWID